MDERALLLLGLLRTQSQHGYQLNEFIEKNLSRVTDMKKATAYAVLERLSQDGFVGVHTEQEGNRPPRKVYSIRPAGEEQFLNLLRMTLAQADRLALTGNIGLMFLDHLPRDEAVICLRQRLARLDEQIAALAALPQHRHGLGVDLALTREQVLLRADRDWLLGVIQGLEEQ